MDLKKIFKPIITSSVILSSTLSANSVSIATDGLGDFLMAPLYVAKGDVCSKITVFNTNETSSILAKVSIREQIQSAEVDLPIALSPGDVWSGTVCQRGNDVFLTSTDDSNHPLTQKYLLEGYNLTQHSTRAGYTPINFAKGYIEITSIAQFNEQSPNKVDKKILFERWDKLIKGDKSDPKLRLEGTDENSLSGILTFNVNGSPETSNMEMVTFKDISDQQFVGSDIDYTSDSHLALDNSKMKEILTILQHERTSFTYDNYGKNQYINFTYPFGCKVGQERTFRLTVRDMSENKFVTSQKKPNLFSPPLPEAKQINIFKMPNEVTSISVEKLLKLANSSNFQAGMIQIKDITNTTKVQLDIGQNASFVSTKLLKLPNGTIESITRTPVK